MFTFCKVYGSITLNFTLYNIAEFALVKKYLKFLIRELKNRLSYQECAEKSQIIFL